MAAPKHKPPSRIAWNLALAIAATGSSLLLVELTLGQLELPRPSRFAQRTAYLGLVLGVPDERLPGLTDAGRSALRGRLYRYAPTRPGPPATRVIRGTISMPAIALSMR